jgi:hypothetical protein
MEKLDKVVRGLEMCTREVSSTDDCADDCPYGNCNAAGAGECIAELEREALELLRGYKEEMA